MLTLWAFVACSMVNSTDQNQADPLLFRFYVHSDLPPNYLLTYLVSYLLNPQCRVLFQKPTGLQLVKELPAFHGTRRFITALTSVRHLSLSWTSPIQSIYPHPTTWRSILILSTHLRLGLPSGLFPSGFSTKNPYTTLSSPIHATCPAHLILIGFITRTILGEDYKLFRSSLCDLLHFPDTSSLIGLNIHLNTMKLHSLICHVLNFTTNIKFNSWFAKFELTHLLFIGYNIIALILFYVSLTVPLSIISINTKITTYCLHKECVEPRLQSTTRFYNLHLTNLHLPLCIYQAFP